MATIFALLSVIPVFIAMMMNGDGTQMIYKPPNRKMVYYVFRYRNEIMLTSVFLWVFAVLLHANTSPTSPLLLAVTAFIIVFASIQGFFFAPYIFFRAVRKPKWKGASEAVAFLDPDEDVIGVEINGDARAYPKKWMGRPHIANETIGGEPIAMSYCALSNLGQAYHNEIDGKPMNLVAGIQWEHNLVMFDTNNQQIVQQIDGNTLDDDINSKIKSYPTRIMSWKAWKTLYPHSKVLYNPPQSLLERITYKVVDTIAFKRDEKTQKPLFPNIERFDSRLNNKDKVIGLYHNEQAKAYTPAYLKENPIVNDIIGGKPVVIICDPETCAHDVFERTINGKTLTFEVDTSRDTFMLKDRETNSIWTIKGEAVSGELKGKQLTTQRHWSQIYWFVWCNYYPNTDLIGA